MYSNSAAGLENLPPTSSVIREHILRGAFSVNKACTLLRSSNQEQEDYKKNIEIWVGSTVWGYAPSKYLTFLPSTFRFANVLGNSELNIVGADLLGLSALLFAMYWQRLVVIIANNVQKYRPQ